MEAKIRTLKNILNTQRVSKIHALHFGTYAWNGQKGASGVEGGGLQDTQQPLDLQDSHDESGCRLQETGAQAPGLLEYRLMRGLSISATCLLSVLQAITLIPRSSPLTKFKPKSPQDSMRSLLFLWVFYLSFSAHFSISVVNDSNGMTPNLIFLSDSCTILHRSYFLRHLFTVLGAFQVVIVLIGLMALSSGYMVTLLCRHKKQCQHLHSTSLSPKASPEQKATRTILLLLGFFGLMYCLDCLMLANGYATISPLVFICTEKQSVTFLKGLWQKNHQCLIIA
ncbi:vomeronasal type-1 receptor 90-like [Urocitellus parryii]